MISPFDPFAIAQALFERDRARCQWMPSVHERKIGRMTASPLAFLRGAAPLFYELLRDHPDLGAGPPGEGWLVGDLHLENFGAFRTDNLGDGEHHGKEERVAFNVNDFDDAVQGPWRLDVLRLCASLLLGSREMGLGGRQATSLCACLIDSYAGVACAGAPMPPPPAAVTRLLQQVAGRSRKELLDQRTHVCKNKGTRRFDRGDRYLDLPDDLVAPARAAFRRYAEGLDARDRPRDEPLGVLDLAFRLAGTGSLGCLRVAVLARGKGGEDGAWIFDMKEEFPPAAAVLLGEVTLAPAERVCAALHACLPHPPRLVGTTELGGKTLLVRRLMPQEDRLDLARLKPEELEPLCAYLGALVAGVHTRGAKAPAGGRWTEAERAQLLRQAVVLSGMHEAIYLAYCHLTR